MNIPSAVIVPSSSLFIAIAADSILTVKQLQAQMINLTDFSKIILVYLNANISSQSYLSHLVSQMAGLSLLTNYLTFCFKRLVQRRNAQCYIMVSFGLACGGENHVQYIQILLHKFVLAFLGSRLCFYCKLTC